VWRMEDVLELYEEPYDPEKPVVCFDELPFQLVAEMRTPLPSKPGCLARYDYEYERRGMANMFAIFEPKGCRRHLEVTERRTGVDFAHQMRSLADEHYPDAEKIRVVLDNLNTHTAASLYRAFEPSEARRVLRRLEFHHTPKHASWLNQVEVELSVLSRQCLSGQSASPIKKRWPERWLRGRPSATSGARQWTGDSQRRMLGRSWHASTRRNHSGDVLGQGPFPKPRSRSLYRERLGEVPRSRRPLLPQVGRLSGRDAE
jgi:hypothetical protein